MKIQNSSKTVSLTTWLQEKNYDAVANFIINCGIYKNDRNEELFQEHYESMMKTLSEGYFSLEGQIEEIRKVIFHYFPTIKKQYDQKA